MRAHAAAPSSPPPAPYSATMHSSLCASQTILLPSAHAAPCACCSTSTPMSLWMHAIFDGDAPTLWCTSKSHTNAYLPAHVQHWPLPTLHHRADLRCLLAELGRRGCNEVLVEAGATLAGAFLQEKLVDELIVYMAPKLLGSTARPLFTLPFESMERSTQSEDSGCRALWVMTGASPSSPLD